MRIQEYPDTFGQVVYLLFLAERNAKLCLSAKTKKKGGGGGGQVCKTCLYGSNMI